MIVALSIIQTSEAAVPVAVRWIEGTLLGSVATGIAVLAVAFAGFGMLTGRLDWRTGARVVLGVFILFAAPMIARELAGMARDGQAIAPSDVATSSMPLEPSIPQKAANHDPYAGAAMAR